jgi:hypothetical protein
MIELKEETETEAEERLARMGAKNRIEGEGHIATRSQGGSTKS